MHGGGSSAVHSTRNTGWDPVLAMLFGSGTESCMVGVLWLCCCLWGSAVATHCSDSLGWMDQSSSQGQVFSACQHGQLHLCCHHWQTGKAAVIHFKTNPQFPYLCESPYMVLACFKWFWKMTLLSSQIRRDSLPLSDCGLKNAKCKL